MANGIDTRSNIPQGTQDYISTDNLHNQGDNSEQNILGAIGTSRAKTPRELARQAKCDSLGIVLDRPKYRHYSTVESRVESFKNWHVNKTQGKRDLAEAGFAYTGIDDSVRCFYCNIGLKDWPDFACPWEQHVIASSKCGHVIQCKGKTFIRNVLGEKQSDSDVDDFNDVVDTAHLAINRNKDAVAAARDFCSDENLLKAAVKSLIKHDLQKKFSAVDLVRACEEIEEIDKDENADQVDEEHIDDVETDDEEFELHEKLEETNRKLKEPVTCKICYNAMACIITLPCGHMISCSQCVSALTKCAVCRAQIKGTVRALMAI